MNFVAEYSIVCISLHTSSVTQYYSVILRNYVAYVSFIFMSKNCLIMIKTLPIENTLQLMQNIAVIEQLRDGYRPHNLRRIRLAITSIMIHDFVLTAPFYYSSITSKLKFKLNIKMKILHLRQTLKCPQVPWRNDNKSSCLIN